MTLSDLLKKIKREKMDINKVIIFVHKDADGYVNGWSNVDIKETSTNIVITDNNYRPFSDD